MGQRRTLRRGPGGNRRPGPRALSRVRAAAVARSAAGPGAGDRRTRSRPTGRAALLLLVLVVLAVSYASSLRAYLEQRAHIGELKQQIATRESSIEALEREKRRWQDPAYVRVQARERFGYLMPGEIGFQVIDETGRPLGGQSSLPDPATATGVAPTAWWDTAWRSVELAGDPPEARDGPARQIQAPPGQRGGAGADR